MEVVTNISYCVFFSQQKIQIILTFCPQQVWFAIIFEQCSIKSQLNKVIHENKTKNSRSCGHLASRVNHVNYKTQDEEMFLAFHFIQVGKLHDPSKLSSKLSQQCNPKRVFNYL